MRRIFALIGFAVPVCALSAISAAAYADDLKLTGTLSVNAAQVSDGSAASATGAGESFTVYSHGKQARLDVAGGTVTLFDGSSGTVWVLDPAAKTYYKESLKSWHPVPLPQLAPAFAAPDQGSDPPKVQLGFTQTDDTPGNSQSFGGHPTRKYLIDATVKAESQDRGGGFGGGGMGGGPGGGGPGDGGMGGGPGGGGGYGGGGYGGGFLTSMRQNSDEPNTLLQTMQFGGGRRGGGMGGRQGRDGQNGRSAHLGGDVWLGSGDGFALDDKDNPLWAEALVSAWSVGPATSQMAAKIEKTQEIPWQAHVTTTWLAFNGTGPDDVPDSQPANSNSLSTVFALTSISNVELSESLFAVPGNYTQVSPPQEVSDPPQSS